MNESSVTQPPDTGQPPHEDGMQFLALLVGKDFPVYVVDGLVLYLSVGLPPGSFLRAVLENDLRGAVRCADLTSERATFAIVRWLYEWAPARSWGSQELVIHWMSDRQAEHKTDMDARDRWADQQDAAQQKVNAS